MNKRVILSSLVISIAALLGARLYAQASKDPVAACAALAQLKLANVKAITSERITGSFNPDPQNPKANLANIVPACRVAVTSSLSPDSSIHSEFWLPDTWNGRLLGTGNGGGAGHVSSGSLNDGARRGFATANTDLGTNPDANKMLDRPGTWADFGYRATHEMTVLLKALAAAYYAKPVTAAYFNGCSTGGEQSLSEAERYPTDYNGIVAGAPANNRTGIHQLFLWDWQSTHKSGDLSELPMETLTFVNKAVLAACVGKDGGAPGDPFLTDPRACKFDFDTLPVCAEGQKTECVTAPQVAALKAISAGPTDPRTGERIYAPLPLGSENIGGGIILHEYTQGMKNGQFYPFYWTFGSGWDPASYDFDKDADKLQATLAGSVNANNPDLSAFQKAGGKLIMYGGTADPLVPFPDALNFYERVIAAQGNSLASTQSFFRYYLVPGMAHCGGGPGINSVPDPVAALEGWVEKGAIPNFTGHGKQADGTQIQRPICAYPQLPVYTSGDRTLAASFTCTDRSRGGVAVPAATYLK